MANRLQGKRIAILAADGVERVELQTPPEAVQDAGGETELLSLKLGEIQARNNDLDSAGTFTVDRMAADASVNDYDALLPPCGTVNTDKLRINDTAVSVVRDFVGSGKPVGVICHGPWTLVEANVAQGRTLTSYPSVRTDLPAFCRAIVDQFAKTPAAASGR